MSTSKTDWDRLRNMTDEEIEAAAKADPDAQPTTKEMWHGARIVMPTGEPKEVITIRVSPKVLNFFKANGKGYQSRINTVLEAYVDSFAPQQQA
jgi:uncharacterized protein (DUF4415 family)